MAYLDGIKSIADLDVDGQRVFVRVDFNVPLDGQRITDDFRIRQALPTIQHIIRNGGLPVVASHLGRPKDKVQPEYSMRVVAERLNELLPEREVIFADDCVGDGIVAQSKRLEPGQILLLENLRFHAGEKKGEEDFAKALAENADVYINDAFGTSHRAHASMAGMVTHFGAKKGAGFLLMKEIAFLGGVVYEPQRPFVAILGGAKVSDKITVIESLLTRCDRICIGGAMAYTFLAARGENVAASRVEADAMGLASYLMDKAASASCELLLPTDHVVNTSLDATEAAQTVTVFPDGMAGFDIGPATIAQFAEVIGTAGAVFWNGPLGVFENPRYAAGTLAVAEAMAKSKAVTVVGGGDSAAAIRSFGLDEQVTHVSTGGGASLELVEGKPLPGIEILRNT